MVPIYILPLIFFLFRKLFTICNLCKIRKFSYNKNYVLSWHEQFEEEANIIIYFSYEKSPLMSYCTWFRIIINAQNTVWSNYYYRVIHDSWLLKHSGLPPCTYLFKFLWELGQRLLLFIVCFLINT